MHKHRSHLSCCGFLVLVLLLSRVPALAQNGDLGGNFRDPTSAAITNILIDKMTERRVAKRPAAKRSGTSSTASTVAGAPKTNDAAVRFRPTGTHLKTREIANLMAAGNPQVLTLLTTLLEEYEKSARAAGKPNDLALALSFFFATNASIYHDAGQPTDPQMLALREVIADALIEGNAFNGVTDRQKQEMYEALVLFTGFTLAVYEEGKGGNAESLKTSQQLAGQNLLAITGISPDKITFTDQGLSIEREPVVADRGPDRSSQSTPAATLSNSEFLDFDPFPDKPRVQPQKPLIGRLRKTITMADLAGTWKSGGGSIQEYVSSSTSSYSSVSFTSTTYAIRSDGRYDSKSQSRASNTTIREAESGTIILSGGLIIRKSNTNREMRYQFVAFMDQPNGATVLTLIYIGDNAPLNGEALRANCGHANGYVSCLNGEEWVRIP